MSKQFALPHAVILFLCLLTIASVSGLPGLMVAHGGSAGAHLLTVAINSLGAPLFLHADMLYTNGTLEPYNHHPPLFFWLQTIVTAGFPSAFARLTAAYYFSAAISAATLVALYAMLRHFGIRRSTAALAVASITGTRMYATYRGFTTFDVLSPLLATLFIFAIAKLESTPNRRHIYLFLGTGALALLISWYAVTVIAVYLGTQILVTLRRHGLRRALTSWPFACAVLLGMFFVLEVALLLLQEYLATGQLLSFQSSLSRQENLNAGMLPEPLWYTAFVLLRRVLESLPLLPLAAFAVVLAARRPLKLPHMANSPLLRASLYVAAGTALFIALTPVWSKVHPFAFLWLAGPMAVWCALLLANLSYNSLRYVLAPAILISAPVWLMFGYARDLTYARATAPLFSYLKSTGPAVFHFPAPSFQCGNFTNGNLMLVSAWPNRVLQQPGTAISSPTVPYIAVECSPQNALVFTPSSDGQATLITFGQP